MCSRASTLPYFLTDMLCISLNLVISLIPSCGIAAVIPLRGHELSTSKSVCHRMESVNKNYSKIGVGKSRSNQRFLSNLKFNKDLHSGSPCFPYPLKYKYGSVSRSSLNEVLLMSLTPKLFLHFKLSD